MILINTDKLKSKEKDLIRFKGFIPFDFHSYIPMLERNNYLKKIGLFKEVQLENINVRNAMKSSGNADIYSDEIMRDWLANNPSFADCVIFK